MRLRSPTKPSAFLMVSLFTSCVGSLQETPQNQAPAKPEQLPTVEAAHQRSGPALPVLPPSPVTLHLTYRVCIEAGKKRALDVQPVFGSASADALLLPVLRESEWQLASATGALSTASEALCFLDSMESGPDGSLRPVVQPFLTTSAERITQPGDADPKLPEPVQRQLIGKSVVGMYRLCVSPGSGSVSSAQPIVGIPGADAELIAALRSWKYKPMPTQTCWVEPLLFTMTAGPAAPAQPSDGNSDYNRNVSKLPRNAFQ